MKSTIGALDDFLMIAIALTIAGVGVLIWNAAIGKSIASFILYPVVLFGAAFIFLVLFSFKRYRKRHSSPTK